MRFHPRHRTVIDGPHLDYILEPGKGSLHFTKILVDLHGFDRRQILLFRLDQVFAFHRFFLLQVLRVFKIVELTLFQFPSVVAISVVAREHTAGRGADLFRRFQLALADSLSQRFQFLLHSLHRLFAFAALVFQTLLTLWTTNTRTPVLPEATSCTSVFGTGDFSPAEIPAGHSNHAPVAASR